MRSSLWHRLDLAARNLLPALLTLSLVVIALVPLRVPDLSPVIPALALVAVYYWTVHRPDLMPVWAVFLIGLFQDLLTSGPVGVGLLTLLLVFGMVEGLRRYLVNATFTTIWVVFALVSAASFGASWIFTCLIEARLIDPDPVFFRYLTTLAAYPCLAWLFAQLQRAWVR